MSDHELYEDEDDVDVDEDRASERKAVALFGMCLLIPALVLIGLGIVADDDTSGAYHMDAGHQLARAADKVRAYSRHNAPWSDWKAGEVRVTDENTIKFDVELATPRQATVISTRRPRIQYSYVKLACPPAEAGHKELMEMGDKLVVALHYQGKLVAEGACPPS